MRGSTHPPPNALPTFCFAVQQCAPLYWLNLVVARTSCVHSAYARERESSGITSNFRTRTPQMLQSLQHRRSLHVAERCTGMHSTAGVCHVISHQTSRKHVVKSPGLKNTR